MHTSTLSYKYLTRRILYLFIFSCLQFFAAAQEIKTAETENPFIKFGLKKNGAEKGNSTYYICRFNSDAAASLHIIRRLDDTTAIIRLPDNTALPPVRQQITVSPATDNWKFSPAAEKISTKKNEIHQFVISFLTEAGITKFLSAVPQSIKIISTNSPSHSLVIKCSTLLLEEKILPLDEVIFVDVQMAAATEIGIIGYDRSFHGVNAVDYLIPGANGKNRVVGVKEQRMEAADLDLYKRVLPSSIAAPNVEGHATVISSIIGGSGNSFYDGRGIANGCSFFSSSFANLFADDAAVLNAANVLVQNHSYGTVIQQFYGAEAVSYDVHAWQNKNFVHVFSAGNRGTSFATEGKYANIAGYANLTGNFKMAKNILTIAAIDNKGIIGAESSAGPLYDGRIAPQLTALGPNGTSDAAAAVSGTIAVMQQVYADSNSQLLPPASLIKAVLYNTTDAVSNKGISYKTGYGLLNSFAAVKALQQKKYDGGIAAQSQVWTKNINVPVNAAQLKITLAWTDTAATVNNNKALTNDLDLEVQEIATGTIYKPWVLSAAANGDSLAKAPVRKRDSLNTAEQVSIVLPAAGNYTIRVIGTAVNSPAVPFHISFSTDTLNTFVFTNPQHASDANREEIDNLVIKWKTFVADTNTTGNLSISYNNGGSWQLLKAAHKIYTNQYQWPIKDTNSTAVLKMETPFGNFLSSSFILSKVTRPVVDFVCADSFRLSWNKHVYAGGYKIFALTDSPYLKNVRTVTDTFSVFNRSAYPQLVYAVEPVLNNNLPAIRSIAFDITLQGVQCFYRTFYYNVQDGNKLDLVLELSIASYTDSVSFERVTAAGQLLQTYGTQKTGVNTVYRQLTNTLDAGITYLRARIKLKNGATVYTGIISVITSGTKKVLFYPNPVNRNSTINYMLQQGIAADSRLQLFDMSGRLVKHFPGLPARIDISQLAPGLYIYKLLNLENAVLETGKLLVE